jgi:uncharacterized protein
LVASPFPALTGRVVDQANVLRPDQKLDLSAKSKVLETQTGRQFVIVTVNSLAGQDAGTYARKLGNTWRIGDKERKDGAILLVAPNERQVWIATGDGLAKAFPNSAAQRVVDDVMVPKFRRGEMADGVVAGADAITAELSRP